MFVGFAVWTLLDNEEEGSAELGDKTMLATITLASTHRPLPTWIGASAGMTAASAIAVTVVSVIGSRLPARLVRLLSAGAFLAFGLLLLWESVRG